MMVFFLLGITFLLLDRIFNVKRRYNLTFLSIAFGIIFLIHFTFSADHILVKSTGGSLSNLVISFLLLLVIIGYVFLLKKAKNIEVLSISNLLAEAIKRISNSTSVSDLFK